jgi:hypothetical protein
MYVVKIHFSFAQIYAVKLREKKERARGMTQVVKGLLCKHAALLQTPVLPKRKKRRN